MLVIENFYNNNTYVICILYKMNQIKWINYVWLMYENMFHYRKCIQDIQADSNVINFFVSWYIRDI